MNKKNKHIQSNSIASIYKAIVLFAFCPKITIQKCNKSDVRNREILFGLFLIYIPKLLDAFLKADIHVGFSVIFALVFAVVATYFWGNFLALVLHILDKCFIKNISNYKKCLKLALLFVIIDVFGMLVSSLLVLVGVEGIFLRVVGLLLNIYAITVFSYYLNKLYNCNIFKIIFADIVCAMIFITPNVLDYLMF